MVKRKWPIAFFARVGIDIQRYRFQTPVKIDAPNNQITPHTHKKGKRLANVQTPNRKKKETAPHSSERQRVRKRERERVCVCVCVREKRGLYYFERQA